VYRFANLYVMTIQILTSVQQTMEDVALKPDVVTPWVVLRVPVKTDTPEMDLPVLVSQLKYVLIIYFGYFKDLYGWLID